MTMVYLFDDITILLEMCGMLLKLTKTLFEQKLYKSHIV